VNGDTHHDHRTDDGTTSRLVDPAVSRRAW